MEMDSSLLLQKFSGELRVIINGVGEFTPNFTPEITGETTLFDYVGHSYACLVTNLTTLLSVQTSPDEWEVIRFNPENRILEVRKIVVSLDERKAIEEDKENPWPEWLKNL